MITKNFQVNLSGILSIGAGLHSATQLGYITFVETDHEIYGHSPNGLFLEGQLSFTDESMCTSIG